MSAQPPQKPHFGLGYVQRGDAHAQNGDHRQAAVDYCRAIGLDAADATVYERLAAAFVAIGEASQAVKALDAAIHLGPDRWPSHARAGEICEGAGWLNRARRYWETLAAVPGYEDDARAGLARVVAGLARSGLEGIDPPGAPPEQVDLKDFEAPSAKPSVPTTKGGPSGRFATPPPPIGDLIAVPPPPVPKGRLAPDGFGTSQRAAGYLEEFREPSPAAPEAPQAPSKLEELRAKLRERRE